MIKDRVAFDLPAYDGLLAGHYRRGAGYGRRRLGGTDDWLLIMTLDGEGRIVHGRENLTATPPSLFLIAPGTTHDYGTAPDASVWEILWVHFHPRPTWLEWLDWPGVAPGILSLVPSSPGDVEEKFRELLGLTFSTGPLKTPFAMNALERLLLVCASQLPAAFHHGDSRVRQVTEYIHSHLAQDLGVEKLASIANLSASRFAHLFRAETGLAPGQYVLVQRLDRARVLLSRTSLGIAEIALEVGMEPFYFTNRFRQDSGITPSQYRKARYGSDRAATTGVSS